MTEIAGYRVVRTTLEDRERRVLAGFGASAVELHVASEEGVASLAREADALAEIEHPHVLPVLDVAAVDDTVVLVRPQRSSTLAAWLLARGVPSVGETVTLLAPIADALGALHTAGRSGARLTTRSIVIDDDGAPSITAEGVRIATTSPTPAWREADEGVAADCRALAQLIDDLLGMAGEEAPASVRDALTSRDTARAGRALLAAWSAMPLAEGSETSSSERPRTRQRARVSPEATGPVRLLQRLLAQLAQVRRGVWMAAGVVALALILAAVLTSTASSEAPEGTANPAASSMPNGTSETRESSEAGSPPSPATTSVDAALTLLDAREHCLASGDEDCLAELLDPSGAAAVTSWRLPQDAAIAETATFGDAIPLEVDSDNHPASVLVVRTDAGWLLRDIWPVDSAP